MYASDMHLSFRLRNVVYCADFFLCAHTGLLYTQFAFVCSMLTLAFYPREHASIIFTREFFSSYSMKLSSIFARRLYARISFRMKLM